MLQRDSTHKGGSEGLPLLPERGRVGSEGFSRQHFAAFRASAEHGTAEELERKAGMTRIPMAARDCTGWRKPSAPFHLV